MLLSQEEKKLTRLEILLNKATVHGDYFLEFESIETCPIHFFAL